MTPVPINNHSQSVLGFFPGSERGRGSLSVTTIMGDNKNQVMSNVNLFFVIRAICCVFFRDFKLLVFTGYRITLHLNDDYGNSLYK
jgi:hypothetical protein